MKLFKITKQGRYHTESVSENFIAQEMSKRSKIGIFGKNDVFFRGSPWKLSRALNLQIFSRLYLRLSYCLGIHKKFDFWGFLRNYIGVFAKILVSFQNRYTWHIFCSKLFKHSNGNNAHNFSEGFDFHFSPEETEGFFGRAWFFKKNWHNCQICSRRRPKHCFYLKVLKTKTFRV